MIEKNVASQGVYLYAHDTSADSPKTGDASNITATISKDGASAAPTATASPTEIGAGVYWQPLSQAETNANAIAIAWTSSTSDIVIEPLVALTDRGRLNATISSRNAVAPLDAAGTRAALGMASADLDDQLDEIVAATNELQADWADGGRLDLILDDIPNTAEFEARTLSASAYFDFTADKVDLVDSPNTTAITAIQNGLSTFDATSNSVKLASDGLDAISTTPPSGVAADFREMMVQVWRRFFGKSTLTSTQMKTYADDGTTVLTTQSVSDDGTTQTQGEAS